MSLVTTNNSELKVLLLEDNPGDAFLIKFYLGESSAPSFHITHAEELKTALQMMEQEKFDIILMDLNLPDSFGIDTVRSLFEKHPGSLVIVLTGLTDEAVGLETVRFGAQDFMVKGKFDGKVLVSSVMFAFERFKLNRQIDERIRRFGIFQRLMKKGYMEIDTPNELMYITSYSKSLIGAEQGNFLKPEQYNALFSNQENFMLAIADCHETGNEIQLEITSALNNKSFLAELSKIENMVTIILNQK